MVRIELLTFLWLSPLYNHCQTTIDIRITVVLMGGFMAKMKQKKMAANIRTIQASIESETLEIKKLEQQARAYANNAEEFKWLGQQTSDSTSVILYASKERYNTKMRDKCIKLQQQAFETVSERTALLHIVQNSKPVNTRHIERALDELEVASVATVETNEYVMDTLKAIEGATPPPPTESKNDNVDVDALIANLPKAKPKIKQPPATTTTTKVVKSAVQQRSANVSQPGMSLAKRRLYVNV